MHKLEKEFCRFGDEQLRLREHLESLGKEKVVWESLKTVDSIIPLFKGKAPVLSIELMFNADKTLKEARIVDRVKSITAKYDSSGKLVMDDWLLKHPEWAETAKVYEQRLNALLGYTRTIQNLPTPEPQKQVQKPSTAEPPKQAFQPHALKTETAIPAPQQEAKKAAFRYLPGVTGRLPFTPEQIEKKNTDIDHFCESKGIYIKNHPSLHEHSLKNIRRIVEKCEEKHIPFTPYRNFLTFASKTFNRDIEIIEKYNSENPELLKFDLAKHHSVLLCAPATLSENLKTCVEKKRDPVKEGFVSRLNLKHEKFVEFLKSHVPPERLTPEEEEKRFNEMVAREGIDTDYVTTAMKKKSIAVIEEIIKICNRYGYDWKMHQGVFLKGEKTLGYMFELASLNGINPSELTNYDICLNVNMFREHVKHIVNQRGLEFREPETSETA